MDNVQTISAENLIKERFQNDFYRDMQILA